MLPSSPVLRPFRYARQALPWLLALAVATCTADQGGPSASGTGYFSFRPVYHLAGGASLSQFGIVADSVRIRLTRPVAQVVLDTTLFFPPDSTSLRLALPVELQQTPETLTAVITISAGGTVIFTDSIEAEVKDGPPGTSTLPTVTFDYVGPGSNIASLTILPPDTNVFFGDTLFFTASAIDSNDAGVASFYVGWKSSDTAVAKINANGRLIAPAARGSVRVIGMTPTGIADTTLVTFSPVPVIVTADSGNAQTALVGDSLAALFVARVKGADSLGIAGIPVKFAAVTAGGAVRDTFTLVTDATGRVRTRALLGTVSGAYSFTATAVGTGLAARTFSATANPRAPSAILLAVGNNQVDTAGKALGLPLSVKVRDAFGNRVGGATVIFTRLTGSGSVGTDTVLTAVDGDASTTYTLGGTAGIDSIRAALAGTSAFVDFSETTVAGAATHQIFLGVDSQTTIA
ncbi:MAG: Ig-like domain-containing protein, partial [Gemmatimonadetes bacterium]|nr:Ig-like domain-containing protein [Gemmatimonadota bacterium]